MNVLSLFDGLSSGRIALERSGHKITKYYASEIDENAIRVARSHYPDNINLGNCEFITGETFTNVKIDLLIGGSPCQSFSKANHGNDNHGWSGESRLFWEYVRILKEVKPRYFLLENVRMKDEWVQIISDALGVKPILINSELVSGQSRKRFYWTNIPGVQQPQQKGILLKDVLQSSWGQKFNLSEKAIAYMGRIRQGTRTRWTFHHNKLDGKASTLTANMHKGVPYGVIQEQMRRLTPLECERLQTLPDNYTDVGISNSQRYKMIGNGWTVDVLTHIFGYM